jgi:hypothetical protein
MSPGTPAWARLLLLIAATGLAFFLSGAAAYFLGSLLSDGPAPPRDGNTVVIEETTGANTNGEGEQTEEETTTSTNESPREQPPDSTPESSPTATATGSP